MATILVINDDAAFRAILRSTLECAGHRVSEVNDFQEALEEYCKAPAEVVIADIVAGGQVGLTAMQALAQKFPDVKIVTISRVWTIWNLDLPDLTTRLGKGKMFAKPFGADALLEAVQEQLEM